MCCMCMDQMSDAVIMECGHAGICYSCSLELWKSIGNATCAENPFHKSCNAISQKLEGLSKFLAQRELFMEKRVTMKKSRKSMKKTE